MKTDTMLDSKDVRQETTNWAFDWPYVLLSWMTLNWPTSMIVSIEVE